MDYSIAAAADPAVDFATLCLLTKLELDTRTYVD